MNTNFPSDGNTLSGTVGGTLLVMLVQISAGEVMKTICLAAIGAIVSFGVSVLLKWMINRTGKK